MIRTFLLLATMVASLSACGMNRAVGVLPNTLDRLGDETAAARGKSTTGADANVADQRLDRSLPPKP